MTKTTLYWIVINRDNDIVLASFAIWEDADTFARDRNRQRPELANPWCVTKNGE